MRQKRELAETTDFIKSNISVNPEIGLILGSGLGMLADEITDKTVIPYEKIPHFPKSTVEGHAGQLVIGNLEGQKVIAMQGRFHYYEGYTMSEVTFPVRLMQKLGVKTLIVTNAAGGINVNFSVGDLMVINDHVNLMGTNPLIGQNNPENGPRFPDMSEAYNKELRKLAHEVAIKEGFRLSEGVYGAFTGPSYETPAEIKFMRTIGIDAAGMSTIPEVIVANHGGLRVLGISCITNMAAGILPQKLNHEEVMEAAEKIRGKFIKLIKGILKEIH